MERDRPGGSDYGRDDRDLGDEPPASFRDTAPDILAPIDASSPVSGHIRPREHQPSIADSPEQSWEAARAIVVPLIRPVGTQGMLASEIDATALAADAVRSHSQPILDAGPCDLSVVYAMPGDGFDVIVNGDHLRTWGITGPDLQDAAMANLAAWSTTAPWTDEISGERRLVSSDTGDGWDAVRILLPDVLDHLARELGPHGRVLVGIPERHLLVAGSLRPNDDEFATLFADFVVETSGGADEPVDRRVFEIVDGRLVEFAGVAAV
jgi:hypothetical protein